jgi:hypothetical protein
MARRTSLLFGIAARIPHSRSSSRPTIRSSGASPSTIAPCLTVFETVPPFRGVKVAGRVTPDRDASVVREAREAIASRYLGETRGAAFVDSRGPGVVIRLPIASARAWDLEAALPLTDDQGT